MEITHLTPDAEGSIAWPSFSNDKKAVVTLGAFDGMHLGHQAVIDQRLTHGLVIEVGKEVQLLQSHESLEFRESMNNIFFAVIGGARPIAGELWIDPRWR